MIELIVACFEATRLHCVSTHHVIPFRRAQELYRTQVKEMDKQSDLPITMPPSKALIEDSNLAIFLCDSWIKALWTESITQLQLQ